MNNRIENQNALDIIKYWFKKCILEEEYFNKFICLWISFNCFFVAKFYEDASKISKSDEPNERDYLNIIEKEYAINFRHILDDQKLLFDNFKYTIDKKDWCPGIIIDMRPYHRINRRGKAYSKVDSFHDYIDCIYQVRCNLFHGDKTPSNDNDLNLVKSAYVSLEALIKKIYEFEHIGV